MSGSCIRISTIPVCAPMNATPEPPPPPPQALTVTAPAVRQVVQRGASTGPLPIAGTDSNPYTSVQAKADVRQGGIAVDWTTVATRTKGAGVFSGTLALSPGWYNVSVRTLDGSTVVSQGTVTRVGVGDIFIIVGQSNVANSAQTPSTPASDLAQAYDWVNGGWQFGADPNPGATFDGPGGTPWSFFLDSIIGTTGFPAAVVNVGYGGSSVLSWTPAGNMHYPRLHAALLAFPGANAFRAILWGQGENDAADHTSQADYTFYLKDLIDSARADAGWTMPWIIARETRCGPNVSAAVRAAQLDVGTNYPGCFPAANLDDLDGSYRSNNCHWELLGQQTVGGLWADAVRSAFGW